MATEGFRIAQAFVEIETEDDTATGLRRVTSSVTAWGNKLADQVTGQFRRAFDSGADAAAQEVEELREKVGREIEEINSKKLQMDADVLRAEAKIKGLKKLAEETEDEEIKLQAQADTAAAEAKLVLLKRHAKELEDRKVTLKLDLDRRATEAAGKAVTGLVGMLQSAAQRGSEFAMQIGTSLAAAATSGTAMTAATGGLNILVGVLLAAAGAAALAATGFTLLAPAVLLIGGAAGGAVTGLVGLIGTFAVFKMATAGVSDALAEFWENGEITAETLAKLSPNAQRFVTALTKMKAPLDAIKRSVQDAFFKDMDQAFGRLAGTWLPALGPLLTQLSSQFNIVGRSIIDALIKPDFVSNVKRMISGFGQFMMYIGANIDELISALGKIGAAAAPFLIEIGRLIGQVMQNFNAWITRAEQSGALTSFFQNAVQALRDIWAIGGLVFGIVGQLIAILFPGSDRAADSIFGGIRQSLERIRAWLSDPANVEAIQSFIQTIQDKVASVVAWFSDPANQQAIQTWVDRIVLWVSTAADWITSMGWWITKVREWIATVQGWGAAIAGFVSDQLARWEAFRSGVSEKVEAVRGFFAALPGQIIGFLAGLPASVITLFSSMINQVLYWVGYGIGATVAFFAAAPGRIGSALAALPVVVSGIFTSASSVATNLAASAITAVVSYFAQGPGRIRAALAGVQSAVQGAFSGAGGWLTSAGSAVISGLVSGIRGAIGAATNAAVSAARAVVDGVKAGLGVNSPSTVMRDEVGRWIPPGIVQGVTAAMPAAVRDVRDEVQSLAQLPTFGHAEARGLADDADRRRPITISMAGASFYGVGSARQFVAELYEELDRYEGEHR